MNKLAGTALVICGLATPAAGDDFTDYLAVDAGLGYATSDFDDYTPALGLDVGAGGRITEHVGAGIRAAAYLRDEEKMWFFGPALQIRIKDTAFDVGVGRMARRERRAFWAVDDGRPMLASKMDTDGGVGVHVRIAQRVSHGLEVSAELASAEMEHFDIDYFYSERHTWASAGIGYRFF